MGVLDSAPAYFKQMDSAARLETDLRKRWIQAGLILLNLVPVVLVTVGALFLLRHYHYSEAVSYLGSTAVCVATYLAAVKWIERRVPAELSPNGVAALGAGALGGLALFSLVMTLLWLAGVYHVQRIGVGSFASLGAGFTASLFAAITEEIWFRGLLFRMCARILGTWGSLLLTSALFGAAHWINPGATYATSLAIALEAGVLLGAAYAATGRLWLPIGLHFGWDFTESSLFGLNVSGSKHLSSLITGQLNGPHILTGGSFGPEASIAAVIVCLAAAAYLLWQMIKRRQVEQPVWSNRVT